VTCFGFGELSNAVLDFAHELPIPYYLHRLVPAIVFVFADKDRNRFSVTCDRHRLISPLDDIDDIDEFA